MCGRAYGPRFAVHLAQRQDRRDGPAAARRRAVDRRPARRRRRWAGRSTRRPTRRCAALVEDQIERESLALFMTGRLYDDGIIDPRDTRTVLGIVPVGGPQQRGPRRPATLTACSGCDAVTPPVTSIRTLLIANRGEIACRIARTCRRLGVTHRGRVQRRRRRRAARPRVRRRRARCPGRRAADTYLRADLLVDAARRTGADAVHPGLRLPRRDRRVRRRRCSTPG